jgi:leader peptidase (prepilin peptidase)/N-methyltransferase
MNLSGGFDVAAFLYAGVVGIALSIIDFRTHRLPNKIVVPSYGVGALLFGCAAVASSDGLRFGQSLLGLLGMFGVYLLMALPPRQAIGMGDVKLAGLLGLHLGWLGWSSLVVGFLGAFVIGGIISVVLMALGRVGRTSRIPFGPWMIAGAGVGALWGPWFSSSLFSS